MGTVRRTIVAAWVLGAALVSCGGPNYRYIANSQENLFFKVPKAWKVYQLTSSDKEGRPAELPASVERSWHLLIDASADPKPGHLLDHAQEAPFVEAQVYVLSRGANETMSLSDLRRLAYGFDPVLQDEGAPPQWKVVENSLKDLSFPKGVTGTRVAVNIPDPKATTDTSKTATLDVAAIHDTVNRRIYLLSTRCQSQCYVNNRSQIDDLMNSWTVNRT
jgi:hypothetical protein